MSCPGDNYVVPGANPCAGGGGGGGVQTVNGGTNISIAGTSINPIINSAPIMSQYFKTTNQNTTINATAVTFDGAQTWNSGLDHIQLTTPQNFDVLITGIYQLEFCMAVLANSATWANNSSKQAGITITRGTNQVVLANTTSIPSGFSYNVQVVGTVRLAAGDIVQCIHNATSLNAGTPLLLGLANTFDYNTTFTWTYIKESL
jgi:hypothetical protein